MVSPLDIKRDKLINKMMLLQLEILLEIPIKA